MSKRDDILATAVRLFVEQGVENTPTAQISREAGVATGTLFHHFPNKDALVNALVLSVKESLLERIERDLDGVSGYRDQIRAVWLAVVGWAVEHPLLYRFKTQIDAMVQLDADTEAQLEAMFRDVMQLVRAGLESGTFKALPEDYLFQVMDAQLSQAARYCIEHPEVLDQPERLELMFASFWDSLAA
ncbi:MAG: TetR/AcrR family transcriptional regulator [Candidatus Dadabacteria bacterium]|nr:MAG: TetR/AcrR family transcriptional regulator [Candidatus Dadabacteria bacterium]